MQATPPKKYAAANEFVQTIMTILSKLCKLATRESHREDLASLLRKVRLVHNTPAAVLASERALGHIESYSERILARDEVFLSTVDIREECAAAGVTLEPSDDYLVMLFNAFRDNYVTGNQSLKDELYGYILGVHNAAMMFGQSEWF